MADPTYYLLFDQAGAAIGGGVTPDGTLPAGAHPCTQDQSRNAYAWSLQGGQLVAAAPTKAALTAYAMRQAVARAAAVNPYTAAGVTIPSDATQGTAADWMALQQWAEQAPAGVTPWVANDGTVTALPSAAVDAIALLVGTYRLAIYQALGAILTAIAGGQIADAAAIDNAAWPAAPN